MEKRPDEIRITGVPRITKVYLRNIAAHKGITLNTFIKGHLIDIVNFHPEKLRYEPPKH